MKVSFVNPDNGLVRAGWRILIFVVGLMAFNATMFVSIRAILGGLPKQSILPFLIFGLTATVSVYVARRFLDRRSFQSLGLCWNRHAALDLIAGIAISALVMVVMFFVLLWAGFIEFHGFTWWTDEPVGSAQFGAAAFPAIFGVLLELAIVAWWEELVFRGYLFQNTVEGLGLPWSVVILSLLFGLLHGMNPGATVLSTLLIAIITPQLVYAYLKTGQLWLPMGLHLGWNFFQASVFGFAASGQTSPTMIAQSPVGPDWLSGGTFGAEGSILIVPVTLASMVAIHYWVRATRQPGQRPLQLLARFACGRGIVRPAIGATHRETSVPLSAGG
jgi:membrane protease YdiL (CAAX protease family)